MAKSSQTFWSKTSTLLIFILISYGIQSCNSQKERDKLLQEILSYNKKLPYSIPGTTLTITDISVDGDNVVYNCKIGKEDFEEMSSLSEVSSSDRNMARVLSNISRFSVDKLIEHKLGIKYIYRSAETDKELLKIDMTAEKIKEIRDKVNSGEIQPYTMIELSKIEISKMDIPSQIDEGLWLTDAYVEGNAIYYIITFENKIESSEITPFELGEIRRNIINDLKNNGILVMRKKEIANENIHFIYIYKDNRGSEIARFDIGPYNIWDIQDLV